jgi:hypothetical protein
MRKKLRNIRSEIERAAWDPDRIEPHFAEEARKRQGARNDIVEKVPQSQKARARDQAARSSAPRCGCGRILAEMPRTGGDDENKPVKS